MSQAFHPPRLGEKELGIEPFIPSSEWSEAFKQGSKMVLKFVQESDDKLSRGIYEEPETKIETLNALGADLKQIPGITEKEIKALKFAFACHVLLQPALEERTKSFGESRIRIVEFINENYGKGTREEYMKRLNQLLDRLSEPLSEAGELSLRSLAVSHNYTTGLDRSMGHRDGPVSGCVIG